MSLRKFKLENLGKKLELKAKLQKELVKVNDEIDEVTAVKKVKITRKSLKKAK